MIKYIQENQMPLMFILGFILFANLCFHIAFTNGQSSYYNEMKEQCAQTYDKSVQSILECSKYG